MVGNNDNKSIKNDVQLKNIDQTYKSKYMNLEDGKLANGNKDIEQLNKVYSNYNVLINYCTCVVILNLMY